MANINPSSIWGTLSTPQSPIGSIPFVFTDGATIVTDVVNFFYSQAGLSAYTGSQQPLQLTVFGGVRVGFTDATSTPGSVTINKPAGRVKIAAGQTTVFITNSYAFVTSIVRAAIEGAFDATAQRVQVTPTNGGFTLTLNAAATAAVTLNFEIINTF